MIIDKIPESMVIYAQLIFSRATPYTAIPNGADIRFAVVATPNILALMSAKPGFLNYK